MREVFFCTRCGDAHRMVRGDPENEEKERIALGNTNGRRYGSMPRRYPSPYIGGGTAAPAVCGCAVNAQQRSPEEMCADMVVAMAYVPWQQLDTIYEPENGFSRGTIFPELDKPLMVGGTCRG